MQHPGETAAHRRTLEIRPYDPSWPAAFASVAAEIERAVGSHDVAVHHIGSTAIPDVLWAKPVIDVLVEVSDIAAFDTSAPDALAEEGFKARGEHGLAGRRYFVRAATPEGPRTHLHVYQHGGEEAARRLGFRDYLRSHPEDARAYGELKLRLAENYALDKARYQAGKRTFIAGIEARLALRSEPGS